MSVEPGTRRQNNYYRKRYSSIKMNVGGNVKNIIVHGAGLVQRTDMD